MTPFIVLGLVGIFMTAGSLLALTVGIVASLLRDKPHAPDDIDLWVDTRHVHDARELVGAYATARAATHHKCGGAG